METPPRLESPAESPPQPAAAGVSALSRFARPALLVLLLGVLVWAANYLMVGRPVAAKLAGDARNSGFSLTSRYELFLNRGTLVLDLKRVDRAAPLDLFRGLFQAAEALHAEGRHFKRVLLCRAGTPVFVLDGAAFATLGAEFAAGQNPVYLIRSFPEKLHRPDGTAVFGTWQGGLLGVVKEQMEDANEAARQWAGS